MQDMIQVLYGPGLCPLVFLQLSRHPPHNIYFLSILCKDDIVLMTPLPLPARRPAAELVQCPASASNVTGEAEDVCARPHSACAGLLAGPAGDSGLGGAVQCFPWPLADRACVLPGLAVLSCRQGNEPDVVQSKAAVVSVSLEDDGRGRGQGGKGDLCGPPAGHGLPRAQL